MQTYGYKTFGVCAKELYFVIEDGKLHDVKFLGGCHGNLTAIGKLVEGMDAKQVVELLKGNDCGGKGTSCADQLAIAIEKALVQDNVVKNS
ncbi:TIGR03905 family TSCPD domain-containing protein [bacterium]|nr:TIGR03905 family TSCPD domain-containing protein [bacterium]